MCIYRKLCEVCLHLHPNPTYRPSLLIYTQTLESPSFVGVPGVCQIGRWVGSSTVETLALSAPSPPARYTSLPRCVVGTISHDHFQMHPHGNWSSALPHPFHDHAATFVLKGEGSQLISLTWPSVVENLKLLSGNQLDSSLIAHGGIVFTHRLFRVSENTRPHSQSHPGPPVFTCRSPYPCLTPLSNAQLAYRHRRAAGICCYNGPRGSLDASTPATL